MTQFFQILRSFKVVLVAMPLFLAFQANALKWSLQNESPSSPELARALQLLEEEFNKLAGAKLFDASAGQLPIDFGSEEFLESFTQALSASQASEAVDYASAFEHFSASSSLTLGYRQGQHSLLEVLRGKSALGSIGAITAQYGASFAFRFHNQDRSRYSFGFSGAHFSDHSLDYSAEGYSLGWQYDLIQARALAGPLSTWKNLRFGLGLRRNRAGMEYRAALGNTRVRASDIAPGISELKSLQLELDPSLYINHESKAWTLPIELSTALQFFRIFSLYGLAAVDLSWGSSEGSAWLQSPVTVSAASAKLSQSSSGTIGGGEHVSLRSRLWEMRTLLGGQFDLGYGAVFFQYQALLRSGAHSAAVGFRAFY